MSLITNPNADKSAILALLSNELANDPDELGYATASDEEAAVLVSEPQNGNLARWFQVTIGVPYAPNAVDADDISDARN